MRVRFLILIGMLGIMGVARVGFGARESLNIEAVAWDAKAIVVGEVGEKGVTVAESWKGDAEKGAVVRVDDLPGEEEMAGEDGKGTGKKASGKRVILFLKKNEKGDGWVGVAEDGGMEESMMWVEDGQMYGVQYEFDGGADRLHGQGMDEGAFKGKVMEVLGEREKFEKVMGIADMAERAKELEGRATVSGYFYHEQHAAYAGLGDCGMAGAAVLRRVVMVNWIDAREVMGMLVKAAGKEAGTQVLEILQEELAYWKKVGPGLKAGWWNDLPRAEELKDHYSVLEEALNAATNLRMLRGREEVMELKKVWMGVASTDEKVKDPLIVDLCDGALAVIGVPGPDGPGK